MERVQTGAELLKRSLSHVLWIGGATDSGKTTVARLLAERHGLQLYHYDRTDLPHHQRLAEASESYRAALSVGLDESWVLPQPEALARRAMQSFADRWPLVLEDLLAMPSGSTVLAEGFGLMPELVAPILESKRQAIWLVPTAEFKRASMVRRNKPSFASKVSDPTKARNNLFNRDLLLADEVRAQAKEYGLTVYEVDGTRSAEQMAAIIEDYFGQILLKSKQSAER